MTTHPAEYGPPPRSPAADLVELSIVADSTQIDVSLPLDVPIADLIPELVRLKRPATDGETGLAETNQHHVWMLERECAGAAERRRFPLHATLRETGVGDGELLQLVTQRALTVPTLYDDVVDAAARLNRSGHPGWDARAAGWMAFAGVHLASAVWVYLLLSETSAPHRSMFVRVAAGVAVALVGAAVLAHRGHQRPDVATGLGWAAIPVAAAVAWVSVPWWLGYGPAIACALMAAVATAVHRTTGTGSAGYRGIALFFALTGIALAVHTLGASAATVGAGLAVTATLGCLAVPGLTNRPSKPAQGSTHDAGENASTPGDLWAPGRSVAALRSGLYAGLALTVAAGVTAVLRSPGPTPWPGLVLAVACAAVLALHGQRTGTTVERAVLVASAAALVAVSCAQTRQPDGTLPLGVFGVLITAVLLFATAGAGFGHRAVPRWVRGVGTYLGYLAAYLATAALIPLAWWVAAGHGRLGAW